MAINTTNDIYKIYKTEYAAWNEHKRIQDAKRQEYLRKNPDAIKDYDLQRAKKLLTAVDMMDKAVSLNSDHTNTVVESITSVGLGYAAVVGAALGLLFQNVGFVQKIINKAVAKQPKSRNIISAGLTLVSGVLGVVAAYPAYTFFSNVDSKIDRKKRFDTMENELQDPKMFAVLDLEQKKIFKKNISELEKAPKVTTPQVVIEKNWKKFKKNIKEILHYDKEQTNFQKKYEEDVSLYETVLTEKEIKDAKKDKVLLCVLAKEINNNAQSYEEKMRRITDNMITMSFAFGSILSLGYERLANRFKFKSSSLPAGMGIVLMLGSTFFATWAQKRAAHVGRFKAKQQLMENPERLVYISNMKTNTIEDDKIDVKQGKRTTIVKFLKEFFKHNKEYNNWKNSPSLTGKEVSKALENIELSQEQLEDGQRLKTNMFKTFYKVDSNTQKYSSKIDMARESIKYPIMLVLGSMGSLIGMKHLVALRNAVSPKDVFKASGKYVGIVTLFTLPAVLINSYFANMKKMAARISDMSTMKDLEDYRFFVDYSKYKK